MPDEPKRLAPSSDTVRELYLKSGNQCAFPGCSHRMIDESGVFVGEMCHIEAALPGGERFNPHQTNEERRSYSNLMLMCHAHHKITDDVAVYPVERLQEIKASHEAKFTNVVEVIRASIVDQTVMQEVLYASTLCRWNQEVGWGLTHAELAPMIEEIHALSELIKRLPLRTREFLTVVLQRGEQAGGLGGEWKALYDDTVEATHLSDEEVLKHIRILERYKIGYGDEYDDQYAIFLRGVPSGWRVWADLKAFIDETHVPPREILVDLRFNLLD